MHTRKQAPPPFGGPNGLAAAPWGPHALPPPRAPTAEGAPLPLARLHEPLAAPPTSPSLGKRVLQVWAPSLLAPRGPRPRQRALDSGQSSPTPGGAGWRGGPGREKPAAWALGRALHATLGTGRSRGGRKQPSAGRGQRGVICSGVGVLVAASGPAGTRRFRALKTPLGNVTSEAVTAGIRRDVHGGGAWVPGNAARPDRGGRQGLLCLPP